MSTTHTHTHACTHTQTQMHTHTHTHTHTNYFRLLHRAESIHVNDHNIATNPMHKLMNQFLPNQVKTVLFTTYLFHYFGMCTRLNIPDC